MILLDLQHQSKHKRLSIKEIAPEAYPFVHLPSDVPWGSENNPDLFVKIWFDESGRVDVNYFHVSVPDIVVKSTFSGTDATNTVTMEERYIRHEFTL